MSRFTRVLIPVVFIGLGATVLASGCKSTSPAEMDASNEYVTRVTTVQEFDAQVLKADKPVLVDFYATWCGPCRTLAPRIHRLARQYEGRVKFVKVNVDKSKELSQKYGVKYLPTVIIFNQGKPVSGPIEGLKDESAYSEKLDQAVAASEGKE